jgi:hypothetical protein
MPAWVYDVEVRMRTETREGGRLIVQVISGGQPGQPTFPEDIAVDMPVAQTETIKTGTRGKLTLELKP